MAGTCVAAFRGGGCGGDAAGTAVGAYDSAIAFTVFGICTAYLAGDAARAGTDAIVGATSE